MANDHEKTDAPRTNASGHPHKNGHDEKAKQAAVVADPRKRLNEGTIDPETKELKPAKE